MILTALTRYYETLAQRGDIAPLGYGLSKVSYGLNLDDDGRLVSVLPLLEPVTTGKKTTMRPRMMRVPEPVVKAGSGAIPNFLCDNSSYLLGYDSDGKPARTSRNFEAAKALHQQILTDVDTPMAGAILRYFDTWDGTKVLENEALQPYLEQILKGANLVFVQGTAFAQENPEILRAWERYHGSKEGGEQGTCMVTGEHTTIARIHPKIKGIQNAMAVGLALVSFNERAYESYGHDNAQGMNAPVGEFAAFAYTTALNTLLADPKHSTDLGDMTVVYWSEDSNEAASDIIDLNLDPFADNVNEDADATLKDVMERLRRGEPIERPVDLRCPFYILGLAPSSSRVVVRFFLRDEFDGFIEKLNAHYDRMSIVKAPYEKEYIRIPRTLDALSDPNVTTSKKPPDLISGSIVRSILSGGRYPESVLAMIMMRIRAEQGKISRERAAIIKAYLLRNSANPNMKEECTVSLNESSTNRAYVLGRLFSVLENVQESATPGINATIKVRYFNAACATPAAVYPALLKLSNHHLRQLDTPIRIHNEKQLTDLIGRLEGEPLPARLSLEEQGLFTIGYYHQNQARYTKKDKKQEGEK